MCAGALSNHGSSSSCSVEPSCASSPGSSTTSSRWPWLNPALGARRTVETRRASVSRRVVDDQQPLALAEAGARGAAHVETSASASRAGSARPRSAAPCAAAGAALGTPPAHRRPEQPAASLAAWQAPSVVLTRRELNRALLERQLLLERKPLTCRAGGRAARRAAGAVDAEPVSVALDAARRVRARRADEGAHESPAREGAAPAGHAARRGAAHVLGDHDRAPRARRVALAAVVRGAAARRADRRARGGRAGRARRERADLRRGARPARAARARGRAADLPLAARAGERVRDPRAPFGDLGLRRPRRLHGGGGEGARRAARRRRRRSTGS